MRRFMAFLGIHSCQLFWPSPVEALKLAIRKALAVIAAKPFQYTSQLHGRNIRLVVLDVGRGEDEICTRLVTCQLESAPEYVALSYAWGDPRDTCRVACHGQQLFVSRNLRGALWRLREMLTHDREDAYVKGIDAGTTYLWIDAICINQSDVVEKTQQVRLMSSIYNKATLVFAWLGEKEDATKPGFDLMKRLQTIFDPEDSTDSETTSEQSPYQDLSFEDLHKLGLPEIYDYDWDSLFSLWELRWFSRIWIVQELLFAQNCVFLYGDDFMEAIDFLRIGLMFRTSTAFSSLYETRYKLTEISSQNVIHLADLKTIGTKFDLLELLWKTHFFKSTDPRDKVFAIVHLARNIEPGFIDYSLNLRQVLINTTSALISRGSLDILSYAQCFGGPYDAPSWVPQWATSELQYDPLVTVLRNLRQLEAKRSQFRRKPGDIIMLEGKRLDRISHIVTAPLAAHAIIKKSTDAFISFLRTRRKEDSSLVITDTIEKAYQEVQDFYASCQGLVAGLNTYPTTQDLSQVYWRCMFFDYEEKLPMEYGNLLQAYLHCLRENPQLTREMTIEIEAGSSSKPFYISALTTFLIWILSRTLRNGTFIPKFGKVISWITIWPSVVFLADYLVRLTRYKCWLWRFLPRIQSFAQLWSSNIVEIMEFTERTLGRSFCVTDSGYVGWVSPFAQVGDEIYILNGCHYSFAVRKSGEESDATYLLRGDGYIHGLTGRESFESSPVQAIEMHLI